MNKMKTYLDVLNETVEFYSKDTNRRSISVDNKCLYNGPEGRKCAFSRCCLNANFHEGVNAGFNLESLGFDILKPEYSHLLNSTFWNDLQSLHDLCKYWDKDGLTELGKSRLETIKERCSGFNYV